MLVPAELERTWVVIPAFNEAQVIAATVTSVLKRFANVVVVDDCSVDGTGEIALAGGTHLCRHPVNLGQGAALATGIAYALGRGAEAIVTYDADGQHAVDDAVHMVDMLRSRQVDVVLGSRFLGQTVGLPIARRLLLGAAVFYTRLSTGLRVTDAHNGLRVLSRAAAQRIAIRQNRMAHASEILEQIAEMKLPFVEVPCTITYTDYSRSKGQSWRGAVTILADLFIRRLHR
ncbi:MAG: glycosyltransferase family 2 protein [Devosia nanyangense]|uniref:Glycosyltransferase family 2 protein n=1 Tax=Devosia nanyangense TaxID=1228055 RepID=A0A933L421_9HYPH|nr:glycosyltransferase family 2 protein [Devosia nanyangense]